MLLWFLAAPSGQASSSPAGFEAEPYGTNTGPQTEMKTHISKEDRNRLKLEVTILCLMLFRGACSSFRTLIVVTEAVIFQQQW